MIQTTVSLKEITSVFFEEEIDHESLAKAIKEYHALLLEVTGIDLEDDEARTHIQNERGRAVGMTWAAVCLNDIMRTRAFVKGLDLAVQSLLKTKKDPIHILYAGTGPYATLILPLLAKYGPDVIQCTMIELNKQSHQTVSRLITQLGFENHILEIALADAIDYQVESPDSVDILLSETMQIGLTHEQQVPIVLNLMKQLRDEVILIPQGITVSLALMDYGRLTEARSKEDLLDAYDKIETVFELDKSTIKQFLQNQEDNGESSLFPSIHLAVDAKRMEAFGELVLMTDIQVFEHITLAFRECSLTIPLLIRRLNGLKGKPLKFQAQYKVDHAPGLKYRIN